MTKTSTVILALLFIIMAFYIAKLRADVRHLYFLVYYPCNPATEICTIE